jgi:tetratricopeptide (TPR) repeat protein
VWFRTAGRAAEAARALADRAGELSRLDLRGAHAELTRALAALDATDDRYATAVFRSNLGYLCTQLGRYAEAERILVRALAEARAAEQPVYEGMALRGLAELHGELGRMDLARDTMSSALALHASAPYATRVHTLWCAAGIERAAGAPEVAATRLEAALELVRGRSAPIERGVRLFLAVAYADQGELERASEQIEAAGPVGAADFTDGVARWALGQVALCRGRPSEARSHLEAARGVARALRLPADSPFGRRLASLERALGPRRRSMRGLSEGEADGG